jgi:hypothetical protein
MFSAKDPGPIYATGSSGKSGTVPDTLRVPWDAQEDDDVITIYLVYRECGIRQPEREGAE